MDHIPPPAISELSAGVILRTHFVKLPLSTAVTPTYVRLSIQETICLVASNVPLGREGGCLFNSRSLWLC